MFETIQFLKIKYGFQLAHERSEYSFIGFKSELSNEYKYYCDKILPSIDRFVVMTEKIKTELLKYSSHKARYFHLPMSVDLNRFRKIKVRKENKYIAYCGSMNNRKDGVLDLIKAFNLIKDNFPEIYLYLIGPLIPATDVVEQKQYISDNNLSEKVIYLGPKSRDNIPQLLINAQILALCRPETKQNEGGFPTKLGEYLATGNPVCVTKVGEISQYLTNGENAYLSEPNNIKAFSENILKALNNQTISKIIGSEGKKAAMKYFNIENYIDDFIEFIKS